jgi:hypothetical protein
MKESSLKRISCEKCEHDKRNYHGENMSNWVCGYRTENGEYPCDEKIPLSVHYCPEHMEEIMSETQRRLIVAVAGLKEIANDLYGRPTEMMNAARSTLKQINER